MANIVPHIHHGTYCSICGHPSHCGVPASVTVKDYAVDGGTVRTMEVCKHCNCDKCKDLTIKEK